MRHWPILILVVTSGCTGSRPDLLTDTIPITEWYPIVAGDVEVAIGVGHVIVAPPGSATAGSKWIEHTVTYANRSGHPIWIAGYSETYPFSGIETRTSEDGEWRDYRLGYCGTGARDFQVAPNASHTFTAALPEKFVGQEFRVMLPYRTARDSQQWVQAASQTRKLSHPAAG